MGKICDVSMCDRLKEAKVKFLEANPIRDPEMGFLQLTALKKGNSGKSEKVSLRYCPFCGTRISPGVVGLLT